MPEEGMSKKRVLIVDDSNFQRNSLKNILENLQFEVVGTAENGLMAVSCYKELKPDIVTIDMIMPLMGGLGCLRLLKQVDPNVVAVMVSSVASQETVVNCFREGAKHYILKPYEEKKIEEVMKLIVK
jgi:two-component system chemotaxis response regulator CheY